MPNLFDGPTYDPALDEVRLKGQIQDVFECLRGGKWWSVRTIASYTNHPAPSVSAQVRNLRKTKHGAWEIECRRSWLGQYEFHLTGNHVAPETKLSINASLRQQIALDILDERWIGIIRWVSGYRAR